MQLESKRQHACELILTDGCSRVHLKTHYTVGCDTTEGNTKVGDRGSLWKYKVADEMSDPEISNSAVSARRRATGCGDGPSNSSWFHRLTSKGFDTTRQVKQTHLQYSTNMQKEARRTIPMPHTRILIFKSDPKFDLHEFFPKLKLIIPVSYPSITALRSRSGNARDAMRCCACKRTPFFPLS